MRRDLTTVSFGAVFLAIVAFLWWEGARQEFTVLGDGIAYDPLFFPNLLLVLAGLCAAGIVALGMASRPEAAPQPRWGLACAIVGLIAAFFWAISAFGFPVASPLFIAAFCAVLGYRRWPVVGAAALGITGAVWYVFTNWLQVPLPATSWLEGLI